MNEPEQHADDGVEDLDVPDSESELVKGGDPKVKTPAPQKEPYLNVKLENVQITSYQLGG
jgi:hypothetical protein